MFIKSSFEYNTLYYINESLMSWTIETLILYAILFFFSLYIAA